MVYLIFTKNAKLGSKISMQTLLRDGAEWFCADRTRRVRQHAAISKHDNECTLSDKSHLPLPAK